MLPYTIPTKTENKLFDVHNKCVNTISKLIKETKLENIHQEFYLFCYLLWNGYFSADKTFSYNNRDIIDEDNQVFLGYACCRHNAGLLTEVLKKNNICAFNLVIHLDKCKSTLIEIERKIDTIISRKTPKNQGNHLVTLVKKTDSVFLLDPTNPSECEIIKRAKVIPLTGEYKVNRKLLDYELEYYLYNNYPLRKKITTIKEEIELSYKIAKEFCLKNKNLFDDFYDENKNNYDKIKKLVLSKN